MKTPKISQITCPLSEPLFKFIVLIGWLSGCIITKVPPLNIKLIRGRLSLKTSWFRNPAIYLAFVSMICTGTVFHRSCKFVRRVLGNNFPVSDKIIITASILASHIFDMVRHGLLFRKGSKLLELISFYLTKSSTPGYQKGKNGIKMIGFATKSVMLFCTAGTMILWAVVPLEAIIGNKFGGISVFTMMHAGNIFSMASAFLFVKLLITIIGHNLMYQYETAVNEFLTGEQSEHHSRPTNTYQVTLDLNAQSTTNPGKPGVKEDKKEYLKTNNINVKESDWDYLRFHNRLEQLELQFVLYNEVFGTQIGLLVFESIVEFVGHLFLLYNGVRRLEGMAFGRWLKYGSGIWEPVLTLFLVGHTGQVMKNRVTQISKI